MKFRLFSSFLAMLCFCSIASAQPINRGPLITIVNMIPGSAIQMYLSVTWTPKWSQQMTNTNAAPRWQWDLRSFSPDYQTLDANISAYTNDYEDVLLPGPSCSGPAFVNKIVANKNITIFVKENWIHVPGIALPQTACTVTYN